jgi:hypothetical protein
MRPYDVNQGDFIVNAATPYSGIAGEKISVRTDLGRRLVAWRCTDPHAPAHHRYFCHGFAFGTFGALGYTVHSGEDLAVMLADEYIKIGNVSPGGARPTKT